MSIYKRKWKQKDGKETVRYYFDETIDGVRYRILIKSARTSTQAKEAVRKILADIYDGKYGRKAKQTFKEAAEAYLDWAKDHKQSWKADEYLVTPMIKHFGKKKLSQISATEIEKYRAERRKIETHGKPRAISTLNKELKIMAKIFKMAKVKDNPCSEVKKLKNEVRRTRYLSLEEEERLMAVLQDRRAHLWDMVILGLSTGLRRGELLSLKPDQIDFARNLIHVRQTKTGKDLHLPMNATAKELLFRLVGEAKQNGNEYLFTNPRTGTRYNSIKKAFKAAVKDAGIEDFRFHDLRHTFGTRAVDAGAPLTGVRDALGHASLETTNRYAHGTEDGKRRAVEAQEQFFAAARHKCVTKEKRQAM